MSQKYTPPEFFEEHHQYAEYKKKLKRWSHITKVDKKHQAEGVLYNLEGHPSGIQEQIDIALGEEIVDKNDGLDKLIAHLDKVCKEDDMTISWLAFKDCIWIRKDEDQTITVFIAELEKVVKELKMWDVCFRIQFWHFFY